MFRKTTLTLSTFIALSAAAFGPMAGSAFAEESQMPAPATVAAAQPNGKVLLQDVLDQLLQGKSDFTEMEPTLRVNLLQRPGLIPSLSTRLQSFGGLQSVSFAGLQNGAEIYDVRFANATSTWAIGLAPDGKIMRISWRFQ
jgi:hypothetical protein